MEYKHWKPQQSQPELFMKYRIGTEFRNRNSAGFFSLMDDWIFEGAKSEGWSVSAMGNDPYTMNTEFRYGKLRGSRKTIHPDMTVRFVLPSRPERTILGRGKTPPTFESTHRDVLFEYDGYWWHKNKHGKDAHKTIWMLHNEALVVRLRETGLDDLDLSTHKYRHNLLQLPVAPGDESDITRQIAAAFDWLEEPHEVDTYYR